MMLHQHIRDLAPGGLLKVIATDPSTRRDIPKFCVFLDHELVEQRGGDSPVLDPQEARLNHAVRMRLRALRARRTTSIAAAQLRPAVIRPA